MQILNRTKGIDLTSKSSQLMGLAEIVLKDADTGKVKEVVRQKNMLTNALDSLINRSAFNFANLMNMKSFGQLDLASIPLQTPIVEKALGGIILFPNALGNDANLLYPDFDSNYPTGYASRASYTQTDNRQGTFDEYTSDVIEGGYRFVYNWGSAFGNGPISAVALSNVNCYKYFNDFGLVHGGYPFNKQMASGWDRRPIGINSKGMYLDEGERVGDGSLFFVPFPERRIELLYDPNAAYGTYEEAIPDYTYPSGYNTLFCVDDNYIYAFTIVVDSQDADVRNITYSKIDVDDYTVTTTSFSLRYPIAVNNNVNAQICAVRDGCVYLPKNDGTSIFKVDLSNIADVEELEVPVGASPLYGITLCGNLIFGYDFVIGTDDVIRVSPTASWYRPCYLDGVWCGKLFLHGQGGGGSVHAMYADVLTPYCATHADLESTVPKTAEKQMTVNYSIVQV